MMRWAVIGLVLAGGLAGGCAQRTLTITSDPPGALAVINDQELGRTPLTREFVDYGDYEVILRLDGYKTLKTHKGLWPPVYMIPPLDLGAEAVGARDHQSWHFVLEPASTQPTDTQAMLGRAVETRAELRSSEHTRRPATTQASP